MQIEIIQSAHFPFMKQILLIAILFSMISFSSFGTEKYSERLRQLATLEIKELPATEVKTGSFQNTIASKHLYFPKNLRFQAGIFSTFFRLASSSRSSRLTIGMAGSGSGSTIGSGSGKNSMICSTEGSDVFFL